MRLQGFLDELSKVGQLAVVEKETDWNLQASALSALSAQKGGPALHFKRVKGYPGQSLVSGLYAGPSSSMFREEKPWTRQAIAMGLQPNVSYEDFMAQLLERTANPLNPILVSAGECQEHVLQGKDADLLSFPIPWLHQGDGGRYGTGGIVVAGDLGTAWQNRGIYRWMVTGPDRLVIFFRRETSLGLIYQKYAAQGKAMPFCIVLGGDPVNFIAAAMFAPPGVDEATLAGGLRKEPITMVRAKTNQLLVPADAEIVIEGEMYPDEFAVEGPFPEWVQWSTATPRPACHVKAITYRNSPVLPFVTHGEKYNDTLALLSTTISLELYRALAMAGFVVRWVNLPVETMLRLCAVSMQVKRSGDPNVLGSMLLGLTPFNNFYDRVLIMEDEVDPVDWFQILKAWGVKCHPWRGINFLHGKPGYLVSYSNSPERNKPVATKVIFDATMPYWWDRGWLPTPVDFEHSFPPEIQQRVVSKWRERGLPGTPIVKSKRG